MKLGYSVQAFLDSGGDWPVLVDVGQECVVGERCLIALRGRHGS
jgi:hypothetical protein